MQSCTEPSRSGSGSANRPPRPLPGLLHQAKHFRLRLRGKPRRLAQFQDPLFSSRFSSTTSASIRRIRSSSAPRTVDLLLPRPAAPSPPSLLPDHTIPLLSGHRPLAGRGRSVASSHAPEVGFRVNHYDPADNADSATKVSAQEIEHVLKQLRPVLLPVNIVVLVRIGLVAEGLVMAL